MESLQTWLTIHFLGQHSAISMAFWKLVSFHYMETLCKTPGPTVNHSRSLFSRRPLCRWAVLRWCWGNWALYARLLQKSRGLAVLEVKSFSVIPGDKQMRSPLSEGWHLGPSTSITKGTWWDGIKISPCRRKQHRSCVSKRDRLLF